MKIFETFEHSGQILSNSPCQFWNDKTIPLRMSYPSSVSWKITPLYFFSLKNIYFAQKEHIKLKILRLSHAGFKTRQIHHVNFEMTSQFLFKFCIILHCHDTTSLWILSSHFSYFGLKDPINMPILRLSIALVKICHIPHVIFQTTIQFKIMLDKSVNVLGEGM